MRGPRITQCVDALDGLVCGLILDVEMERELALIRLSRLCDREDDMVDRWRGHRRCDCEPRGRLHLWIGVLFELVHELCVHRMREKERSLGI